MQQVTFDHTLPMWRLREMSNSMLEEMRKGLRGEESSIKMLDSSVRKLPTGKETGVFYAFDLGGTSIRVIRTELRGPNEKEIVKAHKMKIPRGLMQTTATAEDLFGFIADTAKTAMEKFDDVPQPGSGAFPVGFTFSFPMTQPAIDKGILLHWTKGFDTQGVVGKDVGVLLQQALDRKNVPFKVGAICNDTVGTLVCTSLAHSSSGDRLIGVILGTGCNAAYFDPGEQTVINTEWGGYNKDLPTTAADTLIDQESPNRGQQGFEKLISGYYLGKMVLLNLRRAKPLLKIPDELLANVDLFNGSHTNQILKDQTPGLHKTDLLLRGLEPPIDWFTAEDRQDLRNICELVLNRSADLCAMALYAVLRQMGEEQATRNVTVGIDGSVYKMDIGYKERLKYTLNRLLFKEPTENRVSIVDTEDGSGLGAALVVAA